MPPKKKPAAKKPTKRKRRRTRVKKKQPKRGAARTLIEGATRVKTVAETYRLTPRECEYLSALRETEDSYEIAIKMRVDESGIEKLRGSIKGKTGLPTDCFLNLGKAITSPEPCKYKLLSEVFECSKCTGIFSSKRFPFYPDDRRCADCIDLASVSKSRARRENLVRDLLQKIEQQVKRGHSTTPAVTKVIHSFNEEFGGIAQVGKSWAEQLRILIDRSPGSKLAIDQIREYAKFQFSVLQHEIQKDPALIKVPHKARKMAKSILKSIISRSRPIPSSWRKKTTGKKTRYQIYYNKLKPEFQQEELELDRLYKQKVREFNSAINQYRSIYGMDAVYAPTEN